MKKILYTLSIVAFLTSCGETKPTEKILKERFEKHKALYDSAKDMEEMSVAVDSVLAAVSIYEKNYPESNALNQMYFFAGKTCQQKRESEKAIEYYEKASDVKYDGVDGSKQAEALYSIGRVYQELLIDTKSARTAYREVVKRFPESVWANIAKESLEELGELNSQLTNEIPAESAVDTTGSVE